MAGVGAWTEGSSDVKRSGLTGVLFFCFVVVFEKIEKKIILFCLLRVNVYPF